MNITQLNDLMMKNKHVTLYNIFVILYTDTLPGTEYQVCHQH